MVFYQLTYNVSDQSTSVISHYDIAAFDLVEFLRSGNLKNLDISTLSMTINFKEHADYLPNPISLPIVSERLKNHIQQGASHNITFSNINSCFTHDCPINYYLLEFKESYFCIDLNKSDGWSLDSNGNYSPGLKIVIAPESTPQYDIFRIDGGVGSIIILSEKFAKSFSGKEFRPVAFVKTYT